MDSFSNGDLAKYEGKERPVAVESSSLMKELYEVGGEHRQSRAKPQTTIIVGGRQNKTMIVAVTHVCVFIHAMCFWVQSAVLPYLSNRLGADPVVFGYLQTTFEIFQLGGGFLFCAIDELHGIRMASLLSFASASLTYFVLYTATSVPLLFVSRVASVMMHPVQGAQMIVTDVCDPKDRTSALAKVGFSYDLGTITGRLLGGVIANEFSLETAALVACIGSLPCVILTYTHIPPRIKTTKHTDTQSSSPGAVLNMSKFIQIIRAPGVLFLILIKVGTGIPIGIFQSMLSVVAMETFSMPADDNGYLLSYTSLVCMLVQLFVVSYISTKFSDLTILTGSTALLGVSFFFFSFVTSTWQMYLVFLPLVTGYAILNIIITSALTNAVSRSDTGAMLGVNTALHALIFCISPPLGAYMFKALGFQSIGYFGFVSCAIFTWVMLVKMKRERTAILSGHGGSWTA